MRLERTAAVTMSNLNYALFEAPVGYAIFKIIFQMDSVSLKSQEARDATSDLAKFGKMVKLVNFSPFRCATFSLVHAVTIYRLVCR